MLAPSTAPTTSFASQGASVKHAAQSGRIVRVITSSVSITVGPLSGDNCQVTITLLNAVAGVPVSITATPQDGGQFRPVLTASQTQDGGLMSSGDYLVSATAELLDSIYQPTGVFVPVEFPTSPCGAA